MYIYIVKHTINNSILPIGIYKTYKNAISAIISFAANNCCYSVKQLATIKENLFNDNHKDKIIHVDNFIIEKRKVPLWYWL